MEALVFFHASFGQNAKIYNAFPHPFGLGFIDFGLHNYIAPSDPVFQSYPLSLPWQIAAAGKKTVQILPLNRVRWPELANFNDPEQAVELLEEIHAAFLRLCRLLLLGRRAWDGWRFAPYSAG